jgi:hypothetical protein
MNSSGNLTAFYALHCSLEPFMITLAEDTGLYVQWTPVTKFKNDVSGISVLPVFRNGFSPPSLPHRSVRWRHSRISPQVPSIYTNTVSYLYVSPEKLKRTIRALLERACEQQSRQKNIEIKVMTAVAEAHNPYRCLFACT